MNHGIVSRRSRRCQQLEALAIAYRAPHAIVFRHAGGYRAIANDDGWHNRDALANEPRPALDHRRHLAARRATDSGIFFSDLPRPVACLRIIARGGLLTLVALLGERRTNPPWPL